MNHISESLDNADPPTVEQTGPPSGQPVPPSTSTQWVRVEWKGNRPLLVYAILALTIFVFLVQQATRIFLGVDIPAGLGAKVNEAILQGQFWRLLTPALLHGSVFHLGFNMYALHAIGRGLESYYGRGRFLMLYLLGALAGNALSFAFSPYPALGSSTAVFGLLGAEGVLLYQNKKLFGDVARRALNNLIMIAAVNLFIGLSPGIDNWGHLGGLLGGVAFAWMAGPLFRLDGVYPDFFLVDRRGRDAVLRASLWAGAAIALLVLWGIYRNGYW